MRHVNRHDLIGIEEWRPVPGHIVVFASDWGRIKDEHGVIQEPDYIDEDGLPTMILDNGYERWTWPVWFMVFRAFVDGADSDYQVEFKDGNPKNSALSNLKFAKFTRGRTRDVGLRMRERRDGKRIYKVDSRYRGAILIKETGDIYDTTREVAEAIGGQQSNVVDVLNGRRKSHKGYSFEYIY